MDAKNLGPKNVQVSSPAVLQGRPIPPRHTCSGEDVSPLLRVAGIPPNAKALAVIMDDPDAPRGTWLHWTAWNLPATTKELGEGVDVAKLGGREGLTDNGDTGYGGPCPPPGKPHRYFFKVYALSETLPTGAGARLADLEAAMKGKVLAWGELMGTFQR